MTALDRPWIAWSALAYLAVMLAIGLWSYRRTRTSRDFYIAGQRVGIWVTGLATMSAAFSGFVFLGGPGLTYRIGIASLFIVLPLGYTGGLLCWVVGRRLRELARRAEIYTIPDAIQARYSSRTVTGLAATAVLLGTVAYLGLQVQAMGILLQSVFGTRSLGWAMFAGVGVVVGYSVVGGMVAGVYTDLVQGTMMMFAAVAIFLWSIAAGGGWSATVSAIAGSPEFGPSYLEPLGRLPALTAFGYLFVFGVGVLGQPQMLHKFYMIDEPAKLRWMPLILSASQAVCVLVWLGIGLAVPALVAAGRLAPLASPDAAAPTLMIELAPAALAGVAFAAILAAIMSTADSLVNIGAAAVVRDLPRVLGFRVSERLAWSRLAVVAIAALAALFALVYGDLIALLGTFAFGTFASALAPALALGLTWTRVTARAAGASIATGMTVNLGLELLSRAGPAGLLARLGLDGRIPPSAVALAASFVVLLGLTAASSPGGGARLDPGLRALIED